MEGKYGSCAFVNVGERELEGATYYLTSKG